MGTASLRSGYVGAALLVVAAVIATACAASEPDAGSTAEQADTEAAQPEKEAEQAPTATCQDASGDVETTISGEDPFADTKPYGGPVPDHADLQGVELTLDDESLSARYELGAPVPADDKDPKSFPFARLVLHVYIDRLQTYTLAADMEDGASPTGQETFRTKQKQSVEMDYKDLDLGGGTVTVNGSEVVATLPVEALPKLEGDFSWRGFIAAGQGEGIFGTNLAAATDSCPNLTEEEEEHLGVVSKMRAAIAEKLPTKP